MEGPGGASGEVGGRGRPCSRDDILPPIMRMDEAKEEVVVCELEDELQVVREEREVDVGGVKEEVVSEGIEGFDGGFCEQRASSSAMP